ncbi:wee protein kinase [Malassezia pachydermatis]|uniref:Wee protein kinase n=1 Tax=Malassezia pachydermatis TaxID=77020 RepID=A0A0M8MQT1_9BASI|nr:wee protein kinase [Malassezia pachydermatis]KOS14967.1 wee protein kinase [Malassezia pachydermatis]
MPAPFPSLGGESSTQQARPLREVVEAAMADRSFNVSRQPAIHVMPDTPMKPSFGMTTAATSVRMHRRGRSMGAPFPARSPLFPATPKDPFANVGGALPNTDVRPAMQNRPNPRGRHTRSVSERISVPRSLFANEIPSRPLQADPDDVFESPSESPIRPLGALTSSTTALPSLRRDADTSGTRSHGRVSGVAPVCPIPAQTDRADSSTSMPYPTSPWSDERSVDHPVQSCMDSPNNLFLHKQIPLSERKGSSFAQGWDADVSGTGGLDVLDTPSASHGRLQAWLESTPTAVRQGRVPRHDTTSIHPPIPELDDMMEPNTPTRKNMKWFEATHSPVAKTAHKPKTRPRHSQPAYLNTPPAKAGGHMLAASAPAARHRSSRVSQFEEHFVVEGMLGTGEFSEVVKVREKATGYISAVKRMKRPFVGPKDRIRRLEEVDVLCLLKQRRSTWHDPWFGAEGVVDLLDAWEEDGFLYLQTELCPLGSLAFVLREYGRQVGALDESRLWKVLAELSSGLDFIHRCGVLHLDLKPANILITEVGTLKISDFGMATRWPRCTAQEILAGAHLETNKFATHRPSAVGDTSLPTWSTSLMPEWGTASTVEPFAFGGTSSGGSGEPDTSTVLGSRRRLARPVRRTSPVMSLEREGDREYIAPEVIFESKYGKPADVFSLGTIMLEAACSVEIPDNGEPWHKLRTNDFSDVSFESVSPAMQSIITSMLAAEPSVRPTASDLVDMPALVMVRRLMRQGLKANELDQLPNLGASTEPAPPAPYPLPPSKYYEPPHAGVLDPERQVVKIRGAMIQEDNMVFLAHVLHVADSHDESSPDTSTSLMTEDALPGNDACPPMSPVLSGCSPTLLAPPKYLDDVMPSGMDIDKVLPV